MKVCEGARFGRLTVIEKAPSANKNGRWLCKCDCGNYTTVYGCNLKKGDTTSCGCYQKESASARQTKHGKSHSRLHNIWLTMRRRCSKNNLRYSRNYSGRGITICEEWDDFENFSKWAEENGYRDDLSIDRIDVDGNYCPENCRWATHTEQQNNKRSNRRITYEGETHTLAEWAAIKGIKYGTVYQRFYQGLPPERILATPQGGKI